jgi:hypothetical protein
MDVAGIRAFRRHDMQLIAERHDPMPHHSARARRDTKLDVKIVLAGLWISMLFVFAHVDIFTFWRADAINGALQHKVPGAGFTIDQGFLVFTTMYVLVPILMVAASLLTPARWNRPANLVVGVVYAASIVVLVIGESWAYYIIGSIVEIALLATIVWVAWSWPRQPVE